MSAQAPDPATGPAAAWLAEHAEDVTRSVAGVLASGEQLDRWGAHLAGVLASGGRLLAAGNGGSAAEAQHLTAELVGRFLAERRGLSAIALHAETSSATAIVNDYGAEELYARQVAAHGRPGDVLVLLSTSGRSTNLLRAAERAREGGVLVWSMTGPGASPLSELSDDVLRAPGATTSAVQEGHLVALHALCAAVDAHLAPGRGPADPYEPAAAPVALPVWDADAAAAAQRAAATAPAAPAAPVAAVARTARAHRSGRKRVVVVGDAVLDRDLVGRTERVAPDAPVPVVDLEGVLESPGGAGLTAQLVATGDVDVLLVAPLAADAAGERLVAALGAGPSPVAVEALGHAGATRTKTRVRVAGQSLVRLDDGGPGTPLDVDADRLAGVLATADVVLVSDYGAGTTRDPAVREALAAAAARVPVVWDPHPRGGDPVPGCALVTPNLAEAAGALAGAAGARGGPGSPDAVAGALARRWRARAVCVTAGAQGAWLGAPGSEALFVPAAAVAGGDPCGAGDRFAASAALALASGAVPSEAVVRAVHDASAWVAAGGAAGWRSARAGAGGAVDGSGAPGAQDAAAVVARVRARGGTVVATGGCFDVLHAGHVACLQAARRLGDALVVLLNSDASVARLKGPGRPVSGQQDRARVLAALDSVDAVVVFEEDDPRAALAALRPDVWAKGGDYGGAELPEAPLVRGWGGRVVLLPYLDGRSTTAILARGAAPAGAPATGADRRTDQEVP